MKMKKLDWKLGYHPIDLSLSFFFLFFFFYSGYGFVSHLDIFDITNNASPVDDRQQYQAALMGTTCECGLFFFFSFFLFFFFSFFFFFFFLVGPLVPRVF